MHPLLNEIIAWKEAPRHDVLRRIQQQLGPQVQSRLDEADVLQARVTELESQIASLKSGKKAAA